MNGTILTETTARSASGFASWRLIAEELRADIAADLLPAGSRIPGEHELAERFGVHRNTIRQAVGALVADGVLEPVRGSGTYVREVPVHRHRIGARTRSLAPGGARVLGSAIADPPDAVGEALRLPERGRAVRLELLRVRDGQPIGRGTHWFDATRFPDIAAGIARTGSVTAALAEAGVADYLRASTTVSARLATSAEAADLGLAPGGVVLVTVGLDATPDGTPIQYVTTRFPATSVAFEVEGPALGE